MSRTKQLLVSIIVIIIPAIALNIVGMATPNWLIVQRKISTETLDIVAGLWVLCLSMEKSSIDPKCMSVEDYYTKVEVILDVIRVMQIISTSVAYLCLSAAISSLAVGYKFPTLAVAFRKVTCGTAITAAITAFIGVTTFGVKERTEKHTTLYWSYYISVASAVLLIICAILSCIAMRRPALTNADYDPIN